MSPSVRYTAYIDESGTHADSQSLVVAGYLAPDVAWSLFEPEWQGVLQSYGLDHFHATDCANGAGVYCDWSPDRRTTCLTNLAAVVSKHAFAGFMIVLRQSTYAATVNGVAGKVFGGAYGLAAIRCLFEMSDIARQADPHSVIDFVVENGASGRGQLLRMFELNRHNTDLALGTMRLADKHDCGALQAADILAYEIYREHLRRLRGRQVHQRPALKPLADLPLYGGQMTKDEIATWSKVADVAAVHNPTLSPKVARKLERQYGSGRVPGNRTQRRRKRR